MKRTADVVIIGAGIVGSSIAYHLTESGCRDVVLLERETRQGLGSTGKSMGGVRAQFATDVNIRMSLYSIPFFRDFEQRTGYPSGYKSHGYLFVASEQRHLDYLRANQERQRALGLMNAVMLDEAQVRRMVPQLRPDRVLGGAFCPTDGFVDPHLVMTGFTKRAEENGASLGRCTEVTRIAVHNGAVAGVETSQGTIATRTVVNAAGAWAGEVARLAGANLPVEPLRRMLVPTEPFPNLPDPLPMVIDMGTGFHFRREGLGLLLAWADKSETPGFQLLFDHPFVEKILTRAADFVPAFAELEVNPKRAWAGLYEMTPDHHSILGPSPEVCGLYFANGFSGHGVMHSPATGRILADLITRGTTDVIDAPVLNVARFAEGREIHETAVL